MNIYQKAGTLFWLVFAAVLVVESLRLGIGTLRSPGSGFITFGAALGLGALAFADLLRGTFGNRWTKDDYAAPLAQAWKVVPPLIGLIAYAFLLTRLGYGLSTFLLMTALFWLAQPRKPFVAIVAAALTTAATQLVFQVLLNSQFPVGPWGF